MPAKKLIILNELGVEDFGENQLHEALLKQKELQNLDLQWHFMVF